MDDDTAMRELLYADESYVIRGAIFEVYKEMGPGFLEAVYQECLAKEFSRKDIPFVGQAQLNIAYKGELLKQVYVPDFICFNKIIIEIKRGQKNCPRTQSPITELPESHRHETGPIGQLWPLPARRN